MSQPTRHRIRRRCGRLLAAACLLLAAAAVAEPWIDTSDLALRNEIQLLADRGLITAPVSTYPLNWAALAPDLYEIDPGTLGRAEMNAYTNVMSRLEFARRNHGTVRLNVSNDDNRFNSFGDDYRDKNSLLDQLCGARRTLGASSSRRATCSTRTTMRSSGSMRVTWPVISATGYWPIGAQDRWWAPGWDTNLSA